VIRASYHKIDQVEADHAIRLYDDFVATWNEREERGEPGELGPLPAGHIYHPSFRHRYFRDNETGHAYVIMLKRSQSFFKDRPSGCWQPLHPGNIAGVRRVTFRCV
jgi:hypothetical protein